MLCSIVGAYAYIEASLPRVRNEVARLVTNELHTTSQVCLTFFYHMMASDPKRMGSLNVYMKQKGVKTNIFAKSGHQGSDWNREAITLNPKGNFTVRCSPND